MALLVTLAQKGWSMNPVLDLWLDTKKQSHLGKSGFVFVLFSVNCQVGKFGTCATVGENKFDIFGENIRAGC